MGSVGRDLSEQRRSESEDIALRRLATLVAEGRPPSEIFSAVSEEVGRLFDCEFAFVARFDPDGPAFTVMGIATDVPDMQVGWRSELDDALATGRVYSTGRSARVDAAQWPAPHTSIGDMARRVGVVSTVSCPIHVEGRLWGSITAPSAKPLPPDTEERLEKFTALVATAIATAESRDALARLADEQAALRRVATLVARGAPSNEVFEAVATEVGTLFDTDITIVGRYDDDGMATAIGNWSASPGGLPVGTRSAIGGNNILTMVAETGKPARVDEYDTASGQSAEIARREGWRSSIAAPIVVEGRVWGVMLVPTKRPEPFPAGAEGRLGAFTDLVATALANAQAHDELLRFGDEQATLRRIATLVAEGLPPEEVFAAVTNEAWRALGTEAVGMLRFEPDGTATLVSQSETPWDPPPLGTRLTLDGENVVTKVQRTSQAMRVDDWSDSTGAVAAMASVLGVRSSVAAPIVVEGRLWGTIIVASSQSEPLPRDTESRIEQFTELVAMAVANTQAREQVTVLADEQAALRRVATLVARGAPPEDIFAAAVDEVAGLLPVALAAMQHFEADDTATTVASWSATEPSPFPPGKRWPIGGKNLTSIIRETGRPARVEDYSDDDPIGATAREIGYTSTAGSPIVVEGELWGLIGVASSEGPLPPGTEERLASFTELVGTSIANADSRAALNASRRRIVAAADGTRRQIERDLHDGTQQRLVALGLAVRAAEASLPEDSGDLRAELSSVAAGLAEALEDLQQISRGIHPAILSKGGLAPALRALAHRSTIPVNLDIAADARLAEPIEVAAYFVASEALANAAKHSQASRIDLSLAQRNGRLMLAVGDDGLGGADPSRGSGLVGLVDRVEALGGSISVESRPGDGTRITAELPVEAEAAQADR